MKIELGPRAMEQFRNRASLMECIPAMEDADDWIFVDDAADEIVLKLL